MGDVIDSMIYLYLYLSIPIPIHQRGLKKIDDYNFCISHVKMYLVNFFSELFLGFQRGKYFFGKIIVCPFK